MKKSNRGKIVWGPAGKKTYYIDDTEVTEKEFNKAFPSKIEDILASGLLGVSHSKTCWPMRSDALAVDPSQVAEANERNKRHGVATRYDADGTAVIPDRGDRKKLLKLEGAHDKQGGYGD